MAARAAAALLAVSAALGGEPIVGEGRPPDPAPQQEPDGGASFRAYLIHQYKTGTWTAKAVCVTAWHAARAGAQGISDIALSPQSQHHAEHLRTVLGERADNNFLMAQVPMWNKHTESRQLVDFPMDVPHERFARLYWFYFLHLLLI